MSESTLADVIIWSLAGGLVSFAGSLILLRKSHSFSATFSRLAVPFAAGALLAAVFLDLLREGLDESPASTVLNATLVGILVFFVLERATQWFHHHHDEDTDHHHNVSLFVLANTLHNALDGVAIGSAFLVSTRAGVIATIAVAAHEIPHEIGDIGVMLSKGMRPLKVLAANAVGAFSAVLLAILSYMVGGGEHLPVGALLGLSAGFLIYVASSDLIPTIHRKRIRKGPVDIDLVLLLLGLFTVMAAISIADRYIP